MTSGRYLEKEERFDNNTVYNLGCVLYHLSPGSSMVRASHWRSEGHGGSIPMWVSETFFWVCDEA